MREIADALRFISAQDREQWVRMGMAIKSELGDAGWQVWSDWSQQADSYKDKDARAVWRSIKASGGIRIGTLYKLARDNGWKGDEHDTSAVDYAAQRAQRIKEMREAERAQQRAQQAAAQRAETLIRECVTGTHAYLKAKGFPEELGLIHGDALLIPMRSLTGKLQSVQQIWHDGEQFQKKFLHHGKASGAVFAMGDGESWLCEGYATGLSVRAALRSLYRKGRILVCFSAGNIARVAALLSGPCFVIADNDASGVGEAQAIKTARPYWVPPTFDTDANDFHQAHGVRALANELRGLITA